MFVILCFMRIFYKGDYTAPIVFAIVLVCCFFTMLIGGIALWHSSKRITDPILMVTEAADKIAGGDFNIRIECKRLDEIGQLASNFNLMAEELKGMEYMNKEFISNVSHEVKTPVAAITGFSETLLDGNLSSEKTGEYLTRLNQESIRLSHLCDNMLRISRLDNLTIITNQREFGLDEQIRKAIISLTEKWEEKSLEFDLDLDKCMYHNDYDLLFQVWINLLDNAIKFSKKDGVIHVSVKQLPSNGVLIRIQDEGVGIAANKIDKIYNRFYQCDESHENNGHGLGLAIVKRIVQLLNGTIQCTSVENKGTTFEIELKNPE
jgi:signal transduction histidine kinase